jgi:pimeloyl-ACP methyl ester carboxylesterase
MTIEQGIHEYDEMINGITVHYLLDYKRRSKNIIVFVHGLACTKDTFRHVFDKSYFPESSLLIMDLAGFGDSSRPGDYSYAMEDQAKLYESIIDKLSPSTLHVVAHSMGAAVALLFDARTFEKVKSFANIEGNLIAEDCNMLSRRIANLSYDEYESRMFVKQKSRFRNDILLRFESTTPRAVYKSSVSLVRWSDSGELLRRYNDLACRKRYFWGEGNTNMPILGKLRGEEKCMISGSGHGMMIENPEEFYSKLVDFIR